ncbi:collagen-binding domain-containing protein [Dongia rigui]|uniref:Collagen-binding domain-containing protein n=1 Tax=Dongia rigui TaxID=940149 RepID=A0ABU5DTU6_9PROT|nr:collagen-binding domain-containing protein [Dongia rigui]MDY0870628.1 collagen-binding domain-containing protein [Dongia rigui]
MKANTGKSTTRALALACCAALSLAAAPAKAEPVSANAILDSYNLIVFGDLTSSSHVDGKTFVSGNVTGGDYGQHYSELPVDGVPTLTVGGDLKGNVNMNGSGLTVGGNIATNNLNLNKGGDIKVGGNITSNLNANFNGNGDLYAKGSVTNNANVNANGGDIYLGGTVQSGNANANGGGQKFVNSAVPATVVPDVASEAATIKETLTTYSSYLSNLVANSATSGTGKVTFDAAPGADGVAVFNISDAVAFFGGANEFQFNLNGAKSIVINVSGAAGSLITIAANFLAGIATELADNTVWNFVDATDIVINNQFGGSILALLAHVTNNANIEGTLVAGKVTQNAEIHYNGGKDLPPVTKTPIPAALPLFAAALGGLAYARRVRNRRGQSTRAAA